MRSLSIHGSACRSLEPSGIRRMVAMSVGDDDMRHGLAAHRVQQCLRMRLAVRTGIDDRYFALTHDVADRTGEGERAWIVAEHPAYAGTRFLDDPGLEREVTIERHVVVG